MSAFPVLPQTLKAPQIPEWGRDTKLLKTASIRCVHQKQCVHRIVRHPGRADVLWYRDLSRRLSALCALSSHLFTPDDPSFWISSSTCSRLPFLFHGVYQHCPGKQKGLFSLFSHFLHHFLPTLRANKRRTELAGSTAASRATTLSTAVVVPGSLENIPGFRGCLENSHLRTESRRDG
jgi:hypothetical protein